MSMVELAVKRRSRRLPIPGVRVDVTPEGEADTRWTCSAIDINGDGMALTLPPELPVGTRLRLSFDADEATAFDAVPCVVIRQDPADGLRRGDVLRLERGARDRAVGFPGGTALTSHSELLTRRRSSLDGSLSDGRS